MKFNKSVSSNPRKSRKAHFSAGSTERHKLMSASLSKDLQKKYNVKSMPVRVNDVVKIVRGSKEIKGKELKVTDVYRKKFVLHLADLTKDKANGTSSKIPVHSSNVVITSLYLNGNRERTLSRKAAGRTARAEVEAKRVAA